MRPFVFALVLSLFSVASAQDPPPPPPDVPNSSVGPSTDEEAEAAIDAFKKAMASNLISTQVQAVKDLAKTRHEKVIKALTRYVPWPNEEVAGNAALALGQIDHPASVDVLNRALAAGATKRPVVAACILESLGKLGYESATATLNKLLERSSDADTRKLMSDLLKAISRIGSVSSVEPLIDYLGAQGGGGQGYGGRGGRRGGGGGGMEGWGNRGAAVNALRSITGGDEQSAHDWEVWWKLNKSTLLAKATDTYRCKVTWERFETPTGKKAVCKHASEKNHSACAEKVRTRLVPEPPESDGDRDRRGRRDGREPQGERPDEQRRRE